MYREGQERELTMYERSHWTLGLIVIYPLTYKDKLQRNNSKKVENILEKNRAKNA